MKKNAGAGIYQSSPKTKKKSTNCQIPHVWDSINIMKWGGEVKTAGSKNINLSNTCTIDNFLWICLTWYTSHPELLNTLKDSGNAIIHHFPSIIDLLISGCYNEGKYNWIAQ